MPPQNKILNTVIPKFQWYIMPSFNVLWKMADKICEYLSKSDTQTRSVIKRILGLHLLITSSLYFFEPSILFISLPSWFTLQTSDYDVIIDLHVVQCHLRRQSKIATSCWPDLGTCREIGNGYQIKVLQCNYM